VTEQDAQGRGAPARAPLPTRRTAGSAAVPPAGPPTARRTSGRRLRLRRALAVVAGLLVLTLVSVVGAYSYYDSKLTRISIPGLGHMFGSAASAPTAVGENYLLVGSDTRAFAGGQAFQAAAGSADFVSGARSDTVILLHLPADGAKPTIVSFPRDTYVAIPAFTDRQGRVAAAHMAKLNEAFSIGGPALLTRLVEQLTGLGVDHYVQVDFGGFRKIVDALGGLTLCVRTSRHDRDSQDSLSAGTHSRVGGEQALAFVRDRKGLPGGDLDRIKDQQYFLSQLLHKVLSAGTLTDPARLSSFLSAVVADLTVDKGFGLSQMTTLGRRLRQLDPARVSFATLPLLSSSAIRPVHGLNVDVVLLDPVRTAELFAGLREDRRSPAAPGAAAPRPQPLTVPPTAISLEVRNGTSTQGLAALVARSLRRHGYTVTATGSIPAVDQTAVHYRPNMLAAARTVAAALPGAQLQADPTLPVGVQLVLGPGAPAVVRVHLGTSAAPTLGASPPPAPASPVPAPVPAGACAP